MANRIFAVDGNWYLHRAFSICGDVSPEQGVAKLFLSMICRDALMNRCNHICVAFDGSEVFRYKLYPEYKSNRTKNKGKSGAQSSDTIYTVSLPYLQGILTQIELPWVQPPTREADDVLASVADCKAEDDEVVIGAKDKDIWQVLRKGVVIYISDAKPEPKTIKHTTVNKKFAVPYDKMPLYQTLVGDSIDNIDGVFGPAKAKELALKYSSLKEIADNEPTLKKKLIVNKEKLKRNRKLVTLVRDEPCEASKLPKDAYKRIDFSPKSLVDYCHFLHPKQKSLF